MSSSKWDVSEMVAGDFKMSEKLGDLRMAIWGSILRPSCALKLLRRIVPSFFNVVVLRFFFVYGPGQRQSMLIPRLIARVRNNEPIQLQGQEGIRVNATHVSDAVTAMLHALELRSSHTINVGGAEVLSMREIGLEIGRALSREPVFSVNQNETPRHLSGDISKMRELLGPPRVSFADGLRTML
jgi:UDP-glucose 4-epimerase